MERFTYTRAQTQLPANNRRRYTGSLLLALLLGLLAVLPAGGVQAKELRSSGFYAGIGHIESLKALTVQADGKIVIGGNFESGPHLGLARLNYDGGLDGSFQPSADGTVHTFVQQRDGRVLVGGSFQHINGQLSPALARLNVDGTFDTSFRPQLDGTVFAIQVRPDGRILIGGSFLHVNGQPHNRIAQLNADGTLDTSFTPGNGADGLVYALGLDEDGGVLVGGNFSVFDGYPRNHLARLGPDGKLDHSYTVGTNGPIYTLAVMNPYTVVVGGHFTIANGVKRSNIARFNDNGALDELYSGLQLNGTVSDLWLQNDGTLVIGGGFTEINGQPRSYIARILYDGTIDSSFSATPNGAVTELIVQSDGRIVFIGDFTAVSGETRYLVARLLPDGSLEKMPFTDSGFVAQPNGEVRTIAEQADGKILIGGYFTQVGGQERAYLARLNRNGSLDSDFNVRLSDEEYPQSQVVNKIAVQPDGKILVAGIFAKVESKGETRMIRRLVRLHPDGAIDWSFTSAVRYGQLSNLIVLEGGAILISALTLRLESTPTNALIARLHPDGTLDTSFVTPRIDGPIYATIVQPDGKILIGGRLEVHHRQTSGLRLNANGSFDSSFYLQYSQQTVSSLLLQPDGKIIVGSNMRPYRVSADGSDDFTFSADWYPVSTMALLSDGTILVESRHSRLQRLRTNGTIDPSYVLNENDQFTAIVHQSDGNLLVGGKFTQLDNHSYSYLARLYNPVVRD